MIDNNINKLRDQLFATLQALNDKEAPMDIARARAISEVAQTIINSAKVEVEHLKVTKGTQGTGFIPGQTALSTPTPSGIKTVTPFPGGSITQHRLSG